MPTATKGGNWKPGWLSEAFETATVIPPAPPPATKPPRPAATPIPDRQPPTTADIGPPVEPPPYLDSTVSISEARRCVGLAKTWNAGLPVLPTLDDTKAEPKAAGKAKAEPDSIFQKERD